MLDCSFLTNYKHFVYASSSLLLQVEHVMCASLRPRNSPTKMLWGITWFLSYSISLGQRISQFGRSDISFNEIGRTEQYPRMLGCYTAISMLCLFAKVSEDVVKVLYLCRLFNWIKEAQNGFSLCCDLFHPS